MKKIILAFVLGFIIASGITVYAVTRLKAEEVFYSDKTVKDAIDDLYTKALISGDCVQGKFQLTENARGAIGDQIVDFAPSMFHLSFYNKSLPAGGAIGNGGNAYYSVTYLEQQVIWYNPISSNLAGASNLYDNFSINDNLVIKNMNDSWANQVIEYVACK